MKIVVKYLSEEFSALCLTEPVPIYNVVKQLSPWTILQHHVDFGVRLKNLRHNVNTEENHFRYCFSPGEACRCSGDRALSLQLFQVWCKRNLDICQQANATNLILGKSSPSCLLSIILMATLTPVRRWVASFTWRVRDALQCSVMW